MYSMDDQGFRIYFFTVMKGKRGYSEGISMDIGKLKEKLERVTDPRRQRGNLRYNLEAVPVIGLATLVCDGEDFEDMEVFGREREEELRKFPGLHLSDIKGAVVTIDVMGCRKKIAAKIRAGGGDYLLVVKDNRLTPRQDIRGYFEGIEPGEIRDIPEDVRTSEEETGHGRKERREVRTVTDIDRVAGKGD
jgi:predicted transposase YbfD/YdcC